jgi:hypothetical protein
MNRNSDRREIQGVVVSIIPSLCLRPRTCVRVHVPVRVIKLMHTFTSTYFTSESK